MKTLLLAGILLISLTPTIGYAGKFVTLALANEGQPYIEIQSNEVARIVSFARFDGASTKIWVQSGQILATVTNLPFVLSGPGKISIASEYHGSYQGAICTIEIEPGISPPDKTLILPQGTSAQITLECSTNLVQWSSVWSGNYTNAPEHKFFRIKSERIP